MTKLVLAGDLHLGHRSICEYRSRFTSVEEHDEVVFDNLASSVYKRDSLYLLGDVAFTKEGLARIKSINCKSKVLLLGNHDLERGITMFDLLDVYDKIHALHSRRNVWFSHCPIHASEMRDRKGNIHGHKHVGVIDDKRYVNVCIDHTDFKPITFALAMEQIMDNQ